MPDRLDVCIISTPKKIMCLLITHRRQVSVHTPAYTHRHTRAHRTADSCAATALNRSFQASGSRTRLRTHTDRQMYLWQSTVIKTCNHGLCHAVSGSGFCLSSVNSGAVRRGEKSVSQTLNHQHMSIVLSLKASLCEGWMAAKRAERLQSQLAHIWFDLNISSESTDCQECWWSQAAHTDRNQKDKIKSHNNPSIK